VDQLLGAELYRLSKDKKKFDGAVQINGGATGPFASVEASVKATISTDTSARIESYGMFALAEEGTAWAAFRQLPTLDESVAILGLKSATVEPYEQTVGSGTIHRHTQTVIGLPTEACNKDLWDILDQSKQVVGAFSIESVNYDSVSKKCSFALSLALTQGPLPSSMPLSYQLISKGEAGGKKITIGTGPVQLASSSSPDLHAASSDWMYKATSIGQGEHIDHNLTWSLTVRVFDSGDSVRSVDVSDLQLQCGKVLVPGISVDEGLNTPAGKNYKELVLTIKRTVSWWESLDVNNDPASVDRCALIGDMKFTMSTPTTPTRIVPKPVTAHWLFNPTPKKQTVATANPTNTTPNK